jgi:hypothetical protein
MTAPRSPGSPTWLWYGPAALLVVAGVLLVGSLAVSPHERWSWAVATFRPVSVPGQERWWLSHGSYTVYYETVDAAHLPPTPLRITVSNPSEQLDVVPWPAGRVETLPDGSSGIAVATILVDIGGSYTISVDTDRPERYASLLIGSPVASSTAWVGVALAGTAGVVLGALVAVWTFVRRRRLERRIGPPAPGAWTPPADVQAG